MNRALRWSLTLVVAAAGVLPAASVAAPVTSGPPTDPAPGPSVHSSDGERGLVAAPRPRTARLVVAPRNRVVHRVVPGLTFEQWDQDDARGDQIRAYSLEADLTTPGLQLRYARTGRVASRAPLTSLLVPRAVGAVNGDFFDIGDTSAPLGTGVDAGVVRHGPRRGWTTAFTLVGRNDMRVGTAPVTARILQRPRVVITNVNSPVVAPGGIGLYTPSWGPAPGPRVTDGARLRDLRQVVVRRGKVVSNTRRLTRGGTIRGQLLIGRGGSARLLRTKLRVGTRVTIRTAVARAPRVAIGGSTLLLSGGDVVVADDTVKHPRTALGIDRDTGRLLLLVVDGRQEHSVGLTLLELAELLLSLGAEDALNLDGGGSSTMVARLPGQGRTVANAPSDGGQRPVPNGLQLVHTP